MTWVFITLCIIVREPYHARIFNAWIKDWELDILRTRDWENEQRLLQKYNNIRFLDDEENQTCMIAPEKLEFKETTRSNEQYCVVGQNLNWRGGDNFYLLISGDTNDDFMVLIKGVQQDPDLGVKFFINKLMTISRRQIVTKRKIMIRMPPRHQMMVKI